MLKAALVLRAVFSSALLVEEVEEGKHLERASVASVDDFLGKRSQNRERKANVGNWEVLFEDDAHVYFGMPIFSSLAFLFDDVRVIEVLYRVDRAELSRRWPTYRQLEGRELEQLLAAPRE